jgi:hypothetical protein
MKDYYLKNKDKIKKRSEIRYKNHKEEILARHKEEHKCRDIRELMVERAKQRARKQGLPFNIVKEDIIIPEKCPILGIPLKRNVGDIVGRKDSYSLDKIDPKLGYIKGNVWVISYKANCMKSNATKEELIKFANWILKENAKQK